jgi:hypothetical protein
MQSQHMRLWSFSLSLTLFLLLLTGFSTTALAAGTPPPGGRQTLSGHQVPALHGHTPLGATDGKRTLQLTIGLQLADPAGLKALIAAQNDLQSPLYHQYLTPQQFTDRFAPSQANVDAVVSFLKSQGLKVSSISANRLSIKAAGTVSQVEQAFQVQISDYSLNGHTVYAPSTDPSVPASLSGIILNIGGLDNVAIAHRLGALQPQRSQSVQPNVGPGGGYTPSELRTAYDMNSLINTANGAGQTVALVELDGYTPSDVNSYLSQYGLGSAKYSNVLIDGATGSPVTINGEIEVELDMEIISAIAPGASQKVYIAPNNSLLNFYDIFSNIVILDSEKVASISWGLCEADTGTSFMQALDTLLRQGAAQGQAFFAASGDSGAYDCSQDPGLNTTLGVDFPASDPYVVGVGGTTLNTGNGGSYSSESAWSCSSCSGGGPNGIGSGGGLSSFFSQPSYQSGPGVNNQYSNGMREVPDVSADADPNTGESIYALGGWGYVGGTSAAAPLWAGMAADINQYLSGLNVPTLGSASSLLYWLFNGAQPYLAYHDITSGTNLFYPATAGYDLATGMGTPDAWNIARDLTSNRGVTISPGDVILPTSPGVNPAPQTLILRSVSSNVSGFQIASPPSWVSVSPVSGGLGFNTQIPLTLTFNLGSVTTPQTFTTTLSVAISGASPQTITVPITVVVGQVGTTLLTSPDLLAIDRNNTQSGTTEVNVLDGLTTFQSAPVQLPTALGQTGSDGSWAFLLADYNGDGIPDLWAIKKANTGSGTTEVHILNGANHFQTFLLHTATALGTTGTDNAWMFLVGDYNGDGHPDLWLIDKANTGSGTTEVHILNGTNWKSFLLHTATALGQTGSDESWAFGVADYNGDGHPDVWAIQKANTSSGKTEVTILNGTNVQSTLLLHAATALGTTGTDGTWVFDTAHYSAALHPNLWAFDKANTASATTEVNVLAGANTFQSLGLHIPTALGTTGTDSSWAFLLADYNGDGIPDLWAIKKTNTGSGTTEVHILNGATNFQTFLLHTATALGTTGTDNSWVFLVGDYNRDGHPDLWVITKANTGSKTTEVHILNGANNFQTFLLHSTTILGQTGTDSSWNFGLGDYNGDGHLDLWAINKANTASGTTEVTILNGANTFQSSLLYTATALGTTGTDNAWVFLVGDYNRDGHPDLWAINKANTASGTTEVTILDGTNVQSSLVQIATALGQTGTDNSWAFALG